MISAFHVTATAITVFGLTSTTFAGITFASYSSAAAGSLSGVGFTVSPLDLGVVATRDFSATAFGNAGSRSCLEYMTDNQITINFESAVSNLSIYLYYWRGVDAGGPSSYTLSESFTTAPHFSGNTSGNDVTGRMLNSGILSFSGPVTTLTILHGEIGSGGFQGFTLAQTSDSQAVPGIGGLAALAGVGLIGGRRRR